jgi:hypothetical protein
VVNDASRRLASVLGAWAGTGALIGVLARLLVSIPVELAGPCGQGGADQVGQSVPVCASVPSGAFLVVGFTLLCTLLGSLGVFVMPGMQEDFRVVRLGAVSRAAARRRRLTRPVLVQPVAFATFGPAAIKIA